MKINKFQISFHDPEGHVFEIEGRMIRCVSPSVGIRIRKFFATELAKNLIKEKLLPPTWEISDEELYKIGITFEDKDLAWFEHKKIPFVSYPHEWVPEMLLDAAYLTLSIVKRLQADGWDLKDATANNIVFDGALPVFVDICSIIERRNDRPYWRPKGQFERHFILPLAAYIYSNLLPNHIHFSNTDGIDPLSISEILGFKKWTSILGIKHCALPVFFSKFVKKNKIPDLKITDSKVNITTQQWQIQSLQRSLKIIKSKLRPLATTWHTYTFKREHYDESSLLKKRKVVERWIKASPLNTVLDLGANTGEFSILASQSSTRVIALEKDVDSARLAYINARDNYLNIQVVIQDIGSPSPAMGWRNIEKKSLSQRITEKVDCILVLAILHHWLVTSGIPLDEILLELNTWTRKQIIIEYIPPEDEMFKVLCIQRDVDFSWLNKFEFESKLKDFFIISEEVPLVDGGRVLYLLSKK